MFLELEFLKYKNETRDALIISIKKIIVNDYSHGFSGDQYESCFYKATILELATHRGSSANSTVQ